VTDDLVFRAVRCRASKQKPSIPFYSFLRRIFFFLRKTLKKQTQEQSDRRRRWCSVSPIARGTVMPQSPTNTGLSRPLVIFPIGTFILWFCFRSKPFCFRFQFDSNGSVFAVVDIMQVGSSFIRAPRRGLADPSAPSLARGSRGCAFFYPFNSFFFIVLCSFQCSVIGLVCLTLFFSLFSHVTLRRTSYKHC